MCIFTGFWITFSKVFDDGTKSLYNWMTGQTKRLKAELLEFEKEEELNEGEEYED